MTKVTITRNEYLQLVGLLTLARHHTAILDGIERSAAAIVGVEMDGWGLSGHVGDQVYDREPNADELLRKLSIAVDAE